MVGEVPPQEVRFRPATLPPCHPATSAHAGMEWPPALSPLDHPLIPSSSRTMSPCPS